jgi:hypothetical protein
MEDSLSWTKTQLICCSSPCVGITLIRRSISITFMCLTSTWSRCKVSSFQWQHYTNPWTVGVLLYNDNTTQILELSVCCSTMTTLQTSWNCRCVALQWQHYKHPWTVGVLLYNDNTTNILELSVCCSTMTTLQKSLNCRCVALIWNRTIYCIIFLFW